MRVLITNDDGPPHDAISPYIANFVRTLQEITDWEIVIAVPNQQRSWIGKAHIINGDVEGVEAKYPETGELTWLLLNATPASCANIGVGHLGPIDLVISGPNYGRNTSAAYIMSSGTVGAATEAAISGAPSIALSYSYTMLNHPEEHVSMASRISVSLIKYLIDHWNPSAQVYSINVPLFNDLSWQTPIRYTKILQNKWVDIFSHPDPSVHQYKWAPNYERCDETVLAAGPGSDAWTVMHNEITVSPIKAVFEGVNIGETIDLENYHS